MTMHHKKGTVKTWNRFGQGGNKGFESHYFIKSPAARGSAVCSYKELLYRGTGSTYHTAQNHRQHTIASILRCKEIERCRSKAKVLENVATRVLLRSSPSLVLEDPLKRVDVCPRRPRLVQEHAKVLDLTERPVTDSAPLLFSSGYKLIGTSISCVGLPFFNGFDDQQDKEGAFAKSAKVIGRINGQGKHSHFAAHSHADVGGKWPRCSPLECLVKSPTVAATLASRTALARVGLLTQNGVLQVDIVADLIALEQRRRGVAGLVQNM
jgi:hypothetical protein